MAEAPLWGGKTSGGADGCMSFDDGDNKGLAKCVQKFEIDKAYAEVCQKVSLADYLVIAAEAVMAEASVKPHGYKTSPTNHEQRYAHELSLAKKFRDGFKFGRVTNEECKHEDIKHRMPNPENGCSGTHVRGEEGLEQIFNENIYYGSGAPWSYTAAISGTHTLGQAKPENSGYEGFWSDVHNQGWFNADYFRSIILKGWGPENNMKGTDGKENEKKNQWQRVDNGRFDRKAKKGTYHKEMMLTTDLCMAYKSNGGYDECMIRRRNNKKKRGSEKACREEVHGKHTHLKPKTEQCCSWVCVSTLQKLRILNFAKDFSHEEDYCGFDIHAKVKKN